jgi:hypothetical protein
VRTPTQSVSSALATARTITAPIVQPIGFPVPRPNVMRARPTKKYNSKKASSPPKNAANGWRRRKGGSMYWWVGPHDRPVIRLDMTGSIH